jgi:hypothetical protein
MPDTKISALTDAASVNRTDEIVIVQGSTNKRATVDELSAGMAVGARVYHNADQAIATGTVTLLSFNSERWDTAALHDTATNNSRLTAPAAGYYLVIGQVDFAANATGIRQLYLRKNGTTYIAIANFAPHTQAARIEVTTIVHLVATDYVEILAYQDSGGSLNVTYNASHQFTPEFSMVRLFAA